MELIPHGFQIHALLYAADPATPTGMIPTAFESQLN